jgi:hypothetical protein
MLYIGNATERNCRGITRRELLQVGGIGMLGLTLADRWHGRVDGVVIACPIVLEVGLGISRVAIVLQKEDYA